MPARQGNLFERPGRFQRRRLAVSQDRTARLTERLSPVVPTARLGSGHAIRLVSSGLFQP